MLYKSDGNLQFYARKMRYADIDMVVKNEAAAYLYPWTKRIFLDCLRAGHQCWVLANNHKIVAHGVMSVAIGECHLLTLCVHPNFQRLGYGRNIFNLLLNRAYKLDATECFLEVRIGNEAAITLYKSIGFAVIGKRKNYYPTSCGREDAYIMSRSLPIP